MKNRVQLIGHLGADPEVQKFDNGKMRGKLSIATNEYYYNDKGVKIEKTSWHKVVVWNKLAEIVEKYIKKGDELALEGKLIYYKFKDDEGNDRKITEIEASNVQFLGKSRRDPEAQEQQVVAEV